MPSVHIDTNYYHTGKIRCSWSSDVWLDQFMAITQARQLAQHKTVSCQIGISLNACHKWQSLNLTPSALVGCMKPWEHSSNLTQIPIQHLFNLLPKTHARGVDAFHNWIICHFSQEYHHPAALNPPSSDSPLPTSLSLSPWEFLSELVTLQNLVPHWSWVKTWIG